MKPSQDGILKPENSWIYRISRFPDVKN